MKKLFLSKVLVPFFILVFVPIGAAQAISILYEATDLTDTTPGDDLWMYSYYVSDFDFDMDYGFTIFFDYNLYSNLEDPPPFVNADWDPIVIQPDTGLPDDGFYDALALVDSASLANPFAVSFVWLGGGAPGAQPFDIYNIDFSGAITVLDSGQTAPVPEPATFILVGSGLLGLAGLRKKFKKGKQRI